VTTSLENWCKGPEKERTVGKGEHRRRGTAPDVTFAKITRLAHEGCKRAKKASDKGKRILRMVGDVNTKRRAVRKSLSHNEKGLDGAQYQRKRIG